jgi:hypothetical protein
MEDIQTLRKPSNIPPVTLEELNDYSEGNKDKWINNHKIGESIRFSRDFNPYRIYYLATNLVNYTGKEEMIGYIKGGLVFLPFYKRIIKTGGPTGKWEDYTTNFDIGGQIKYAFVFFDLGPNKPAEREEGRSREDEERARRRAAEDDTRDSRTVEEAKARSLRLMEQMDTQREAEEKKREEKRLAAAERLREVERKGEEGEGEGIQLKTKNPETGKWEGGRRTRRKRSTHKRRTLRNSSRRRSSRKLSSRKLSSRKLSSRKLSSRKLRKSRK